MTSCHLDSFVGRESPRVIQSAKIKKTGAQSISLLPSSTKNLGFGSGSDALIRLALDFPHLHRQTPRRAWALRNDQAGRKTQPLPPRELKPRPGGIADENQLRGDRGFRRRVLVAWCALVWSSVQPAMDGAGRDHDGTSQEHEPRASLRHHVSAESADCVRSRAVVPVEKCEYRCTRRGGRRIALDRHCRAGCIHNLYVRDATEG